MFQYQARSSGPLESDAVIADTSTEWFHETSQPIRRQKRFCESWFSGQLEAREQVDVTFEWHMVPQQPNWAAWQLAMMTGRENEIIVVPPASLAHPVVSAIEDNPSDFIFDSVVIRGREED